MNFPRTKKVWNLNFKQLRVEKTNISKVDLKNNLWSNWQLKFSKMSLWNNVASKSRWQVSSPLSPVPSTYKAFLSSWKTHRRLQKSTFHNWKGRKISGDWKKHIEMGWLVDRTSLPNLWISGRAQQPSLLCFPGRWGTDSTKAACSCRETWAHSSHLSSPSATPLPPLALLPLFIGNTNHSFQSRHYFP